MKSPTLQFDMMCISSYSDDDTESSISTGRTMSSISISPSNHDIATLPIDHGSSSIAMSNFQHAMEANPDSIISKNTYFMDGGNRFISVPMLGNTNTKGGSGISRLFEEWLANKLYHQPVSSNTEVDDTMMMDMDEDNAPIVVDQRLPILQDQVELIAEDILNTMKSFSYLCRRKGLEKIMIKIRTGHVYTYHSLEDGQPLITQDMEELFQQFPLFVECQVFTNSSSSHLSNPTTQLLLSVENVTINPGHPYTVMDEF